MNPFDPRPANLDANRMNKSAFDRMLLELTARTQTTRPSPRFSWLTRLYWRTLGAWLFQSLRHFDALYVANRACPHCGYEFEWGHPPYFKQTRSGLSFNGEMSYYWFEGEQTCPRCGQHFAYSDTGA